MSNITLTIPNDDHIALRAFGKALEEMALAHGAEPRKTTIDTSEATAVTDELVQTAPRMMDEPEIDTTAQQVESLAVPMGDNEEQVPPTADSTGTPWDERIHSTSKALNVDGTWRLRRKPKDMDEEEWAAFVESVKGELSGNTVAKDVRDEIMLQKWDELEHHMAIDPAHDKGDETTTFTVEPPVTPPGDDYHTDIDVVSEQTVAGIPPLPVPPPVVVAPPVTEWDFPRLMTFLTERHGKIDVATVNTLLAQDGMLSVQELNAHPDKIGPFVARVKAHLGE